MEADFLIQIIFWVAIIAVELVFFILAFVLLKKGGLWKLLMFRLRNGSLFVNAGPDNGIYFDFARKHRQVVQFEITDEQGRKKIIPTRITQVKHHLAGSSSPVHFCIIGQDENVNLLEKFKPSKSSEYWNQWGKSLYQEGVNTGRMLRDEQSGFWDWHNATTWLLIITVCCSLALLAMNWMVLNNIQPPAPIPVAPLA
jgi:hypothetical protein